MVVSPDYSGRLIYEFKEKSAEIIDKYGVEYNSKDLKTLGAGIASAAEDIINSFNFLH